MAGPLGVVAAGHPRSAQAGANALREGGNAVDAALAAMLTAFSCEPLLTSLGAGGYMLVVEPGGEPVLLDFFVEAARAGDVVRQPELADALERLGAEGPAPFYTGDIAGAIVEWLAARGGVVS